MRLRCNGLSVFFLNDGLFDCRVGELLDLNGFFLMVVMVVELFSIRFC